MKLAQLVFVAASAAIAAVPAAAKSTFTPPAAVNTMTNATCMVQNVGTKARTVTAVLRNQDGVEVQTVSLEVPPGAVRTLTGANNDVGLYCEFIGLNRSVRGWLHVYGSSTELLLPAAK